MANGQDLIPTGAPDLPVSATARPKQGLLGELQQDRRVYLTALKVVRDVGGVFLGPLFSGGVTLLEAFANAADDTELNAKFDDLRDLNTRTDEKLKALAALAELILQQQDEIARQLEQQGTPAASQIDGIAKATALAAYRLEIAQRFFYADFRGIAGSATEEHVASFPADRIYVIPRLHAETELRHEREQEDDLQRRLESVEDLGEQERRRLEDELAALRHRRWAGQSEETADEEGKPIGEALISARHCVILGPPGVGKSALTRHLARTCGLGAEAIQERLGWDEPLVPILLPVAAYAEARRQKPNLSLAAYLQESLCERYGTAVQQALAEAIQRGNAIVLLDGVDEVPEEGDRLSAVRAVDTFLSQHKRARCIVTSRPAGYFRLAGHIPHFELRNFSPSQVREFVNKWQKAFEERRHSEHPDFARAEAEAEQMLKEIQSHSRVAALTRNPLMLVIVALIRHHELQLPQRRVELYQLAVRMLLDTWNRLRSEPGIDRGGTSLPLERLLPVWARVAAWMRREQPTGFVHRADLKRKLVEVLEEDEEEEPSLTAESYLEAVVKQAGLLEERFRNRFAFWHPTFEEFLAAVAMATPSSATAERLLPLRADPRWREVILLALGYIGIINYDQASATSVLQTLLEREPGPLEPITHANLRLAAACIADDVGVRRSLVEDVLTKFADVLTRQPYHPLVASFTELFDACSTLRPRPETVHALAPLTSSADRQVRIAVTRLLSNVTEENAEALRLCRERLADDDEDVRVHAAIGLARTGDFSPSVCSALGRFRSPSSKALESVTRLLRDDAALASVLGAENPRLRLEAARLLIEQGRSDERAFRALSSVLQEEDLLLRTRAAQLLIEQGRGDERVFETLTSVLEAGAPRVVELSITAAAPSGPMFKVVAATFEAARLLLEQGRGDERVFHVLASSLGAEDPTLRFEAARLLLEQGRGDERVFEALASLLEVEGHVEALLAFPRARLLIDQGRADGRVFEFLVRASVLLPDFLVGACLAQLKRADQNSFEALNSLLGAEDPTLRSGAARLLIEQGCGHERAFEALVSVLGAENPRLRLEAARLLIEQGRGDERAFEALVSLLGAEDLSLRFSAAQILVEHDRGDEAFEALISMLAHASRWWRVEAARMLIEQGKDAERVAEVLVSVLGDEPPGSLAHTLKRLFQREQLTSEDGEYLAALASLQESDDGARRSARSVLFDLVFEGTDSADS